MNQPFPQNPNIHINNNINPVPHFNNTYENIFQKNTIDNNLFSFNPDNKSNIKKKVKKQDDNLEGSFSINLEEVNISLFL